MNVRKDCVAHLLSGETVLLRIDGRNLVFPISEDSTYRAELPRLMKFPHNILGVFPTAGQGEATGRMYVLLNGPDPLVELDVSGGTYLTVLSAATQDAYLKRWNSTASLVNLVPSEKGRFVAATTDDGRVALHRLCSDHGHPTFEAVNVWSFGSGATVCVTGFDTKEVSGAGARMDASDCVDEETVHSISVVVSKNGQVNHYTINPN